MIDDWHILLQYWVLQTIYLHLTVAAIPIYKNKLKDVGMAAPIIRETYMQQDRG